METRIIEAEGKSMNAQVKPALRAAVYARASTKEQIQSCDGQLRECRDKAKLLGLKIVHEFIDDGISGSRGDRPAYLKMLKSATAKEFDVLLLFAQSRLGRDSLEAERAMRQLEFGAVRIISLDGYDSAMSISSRKMLRGVKNLMNEQFLDDLKIRLVTKICGRASARVICQVHEATRFPGFQET